MEIEAEGGSRSALQLQSVVLNSQKTTKRRWCEDSLRVSRIPTAVPANDNLKIRVRLPVEPRHLSGKDGHLLLSQLSVSSIVWQFMTLFLSLACSEVTFSTRSLAHVITTHQQTAFRADFIFIYIQTGCRQPSVQRQDAFAPKLSPVL